MDIKEYHQPNNAAAERHFWEQAKAGFLLKLLGKYASELNTVTDIGCGDCYIASRIAEKFPALRIHGVDSALSDELIQTFEAEFAARGLPVTISQTLPEGKSDAVFMFDVLEHIENDREYLANLPTLDPGGLLVLTVPAFQSLFCAHDTFLGHHRRYRRKQLIAIAEAAGFKTLDSGYFFSSLLSFRLLQKLLRRDSSGLNSDTNKFNSLCAKILYFDAMTGHFFKYLKIQIPGLSCYLICRKR